MWLGSGKRGLDEMGMEACMTNPGVVYHLREWRGDRVKTKSKKSTVKSFFEGLNGTGFVCRWWMKMPPGFMSMWVKNTGPSRSVHSCVAQQLTNLMTN